jgi:hypothetical protein
MDAAAIYLIISGIWGVATIIGFVVAIRICYGIEAHLPDAVSAVRHWPCFARVLTVAFNNGVARDADTQTMLRRMNRILLLIMLGFAAHAAYALLVSSTR